MGASKPVNIWTLSLKSFTSPRLTTPILFLISSFKLMLMFASSVAVVELVLPLHRLEGQPVLSSISGPVLRADRALLINRVGGLNPI